MKNIAIERKQNMVFQLVYVKENRNRYGKKHLLTRTIANRVVSAKLKAWVYLTAALKGKYVAIEDIGNGIWIVFNRNVFLGFFDERHLRNKEQVTRLETNLV